MTVIPASSGPLLPRSCLRKRFSTRPLQGPGRTPGGTSRGQARRTRTMIRLSNITERFANAGLLLMAALPLLAIGALAH